MMRLAVATLVVLTLAACGQSSSDMSGGSAGASSDADAVVRVGGQEFTQSAINCEHTPIVTSLRGMTLDGTQRFPDQSGGLITVMNDAVYAPVSGITFYGFPIEGAVNESWIVTGAVDAVAAAAAAARGVTPDQVRTTTPAGTPAYWSQAPLSDMDDWSPQFATQASGGRYRFEDAVRSYQFPTTTSPDGIRATLILLRLTDTTTLAQCLTIDPTRG